MLNYVFENVSLTKECLLFTLQCEASARRKRSVHEHMFETRASVKLLGNKAAVPYKGIRT